MSQQNQTRSEEKRQAFVIRRTRTSSTGRTIVQYLAGRGVEEFTTPGNTRTGVGVANLKTWKTAAGAQRWMDERPGFEQAHAKIGTIEVVPA